MWMFSSVILDFRQLRTSFSIWSPEHVQRKSPLCMFKPPIHVLSSFSLSSRLYFFWNKCSVLNWPWIYLHFSVVSILNAVTAAPHLMLHTFVAGQWLSPLRANPYPTRDCLRLNNQIKWRREIFTLLKIFSVCIPLKFTKSCIHVHEFRRQVLACKPRRQFLISQPFYYVIT